jgi:hypothetical protein
MNPSNPSDGQTVNICGNWTGYDSCFAYYGGTLEQSGNHFNATFYFEDKHRPGIFCLLYPKPMRGCQEAGLLASASYTVEATAWLVVIPSPGMPPEIKGSLGNDSLVFQVNTPTPTPTSTPTSFPSPTPTVGVLSEVDRWFMFE